MTHGEVAIQVILFHIFLLGDRWAEKDKPLRRSQHKMHWVNFSHKLNHQF